ncbi:MAG: YczE/YyaS/YitT family protein [Nocardioidaceae bacterium]
MDSLTALEQLRAGNLLRRVPQLLIGLFLFGWSLAMMVEADLGLAPWDVFHQGLSHYFPLSFGTIVILVGAVVLTLWIPLRQWPGLGTVLNVIICGLAADLGLAVIGEYEAILPRIGLLVGGVVLNGLATAMYVGTHLGPGPRDGLSVGLVHATGRSLRLVRTGVEAVVLVVGWTLGGTIGVGTVLYALGIGPLWQLFRPWTEVRLETGDEADGPLAA